MKLIIKKLKILAVIAIVTIIFVKINYKKTDDIDIVLNSRVSTAVKIKNLQGRISTFKFNEPLEKNWSTKDKKYFEKLNDAINELKSD